MVRLSREVQYRKARLLRRDGVGYNDIARKVGSAKSTVSLWCRDIRLTSEQRHVLLRSPARRRAQQIGAHANREKRQRAIAVVREKAKQEINTLTPDALKIAGAMLYWAEGAKTVSTALSNSDSRMVRFFIVWLREVLEISPTRLTAHLHIHKGNNDDKIKRFWSRLTGIPLRNFGKSFIKPAGTGRRTNILPNGIIKIRVRGAGTEDLRHRILAWSEKVYELRMNIRP